MLAKLLCWTALICNIFAAGFAGRWLLTAGPDLLRALPQPTALAAGAAASSFLLVGPVVAVFVLASRAPLLQRAGARKAI